MRVFRPHLFIVGYNTVTLNTEYTLVGLCFQKPDGTDMTLDEAIPYKEGMTKAMAIADADNLQVWNKSENKYDLYFLSNGQYGKSTNPSYDAKYDGKWLQSAGAACNAKLPAGTAFWYKSKTASKESPLSLTMAGAILQTATTTPQTVTVNYTLFSNPYAADAPINECLVTENATKAMAIADADNLQVWNKSENKYDLYFLSNGQYGKSTNPSYDAKYDGKWHQSAGAECNASIPAGTSFWYLSRNANTTVSITNPVK